MSKDRIKTEKNSKAKIPKVNGYKKNAQGKFVKGTAPGPGRPPGSISVIGRIKQIWEQDPERFEKFVNEVMNDKFMRRELIQQVDGAPRQKIEVKASVQIGEMENLTNEELNRIAEES